LADRPYFRAEEIFSYRYGGPFHGHRTRPSASGRARLAEVGVHLPPLDSPERRRRVLRLPCRCRVPPKRPERRPQSQRFSYSASPEGGYLPMLRVGVANCQPSTEPIQQHSGANPKRRLGKPRDADPQRGAKHGGSATNVELSSQPVGDRGILALAANQVMEQVRGDARTSRKHSARNSRRATHRGRFGAHGARHGGRTTGVPGDQPPLARSIASPSYTHRPRFQWGHAPGGSRADGRFPPGEFVWEKLKIDSCPRKRPPDPHAELGHFRGQ
jgi:hypothetical protein